MNANTPRLILPEHLAYDLEIRVMFNTKNGNTEMRLISKTLKQINTLQVAGVLSEHSTALLRGIVSGTLKPIPITEEGVSNGNQS